MSTYIPTDSSVNVHRDFVDMFSAVSAIIHSYSIECVYNTDDFNAHTSVCFLY